MITVKILELPDVEGKKVKDASDWIAARGPDGAGDELETLVAQTPQWLPGVPQASGLSEGDDALTREFGEPLFLREDGVGVVSVNERWFAARYFRTGHVLFEPDEKAFYEYTPATGLWRRVSDDYIAKMLCTQIFDHGRTNLVSLDSKVTMKRVSGVYQALRGIAESRNAFAGKRDFVHCSNGIERLDSFGNFNLEPFKPSNFSRNACPIEFRPGAQCPKFVNFLTSALSPFDCDLLQRWAGLALAGENPAQRILILVGEAASGKSTFAKIFENLTGRDNCAQLRTECLLDRFEIAGFLGKTLLLAPDVPGDFLNRRSASVLKSLVGGDSFRAEMKGSNLRHALEGSFNILMTCNSRLIVRLDGDREAWRRRLIVIEFNHPVKERIANFDKALIAEEGSGILLWALHGLQAARSEIASLGDLVLTPDQSARVAMLLNESDSLRQFVSQDIERAVGDVTSDELVTAYFEFCTASEWAPQTRRFVQTHLEDLLSEIHHASRRNDISRNGRSAVGWKGISLKESPDRRDT